MVEFFKRLFGWTPKMTEREKLASRLAYTRMQWLLDAPLFVDDSLVERMFDAIVRPEYDVQSRVVGTLNQEAHTRLTGGEVGGKYGLGISFLTGKVDVEGKLKHERERSSTTGTTLDVTEQRVRTSGRRLEEIAAVYLNSHPERIVFINPDGTAETFGGSTLATADLWKAAADPPRMLAFLDLAPKCTILPMACELQSGESILLFDRYIERLWSEAEEKPAYPSAGLDEAARRAAWRQYWAALSDRFSSRIAMELVEQAGHRGAEGHGRLGWIDFRVPIGAEGDAMHLHVVPDGKYHAGTFAYNFVRRGNSHGVRVVGTLKAGIDMNVLAVFDN